MPDYRRNWVPGGTFFFTVNLLDRRWDLLVTQIDALREAVRQARRRPLDDPVKSSRRGWRRPHHKHHLDLGMRLSGGVEIFRIYLRLGTWFLVVTLEHRRTDFGTARPLAAPLPGMGLVVVQSVGIGLHDFTGFEKQQAEFIRGHARDKGFGGVESRAETRSDIFRVKGLTAVQGTPVSGGIVGVPPDFGNQALRREAGRFFNAAQMTAPSGRMVS
jgi:hypothetical protein